MSIIILKTDEKKEKVKREIGRLKVSTGLDAQKYCGKITIDEDPLLYQKKSRNEWE